MIIVIDENSINGPFNDMNFILSKLKLLDGMNGDYYYGTEYRRICSRVICQAII